MHLLVTVAGIGDRIVTAGEGAKVGALIDALGGQPSQVLTIGRTDQVLERDFPLVSAGLRSGDIITMRQRVHATGILAGKAPVVFRVVSGPARGETYDLTFGITSIGRVAANDLTIIDPGMSRQHATVSITRTEVSIADNHSTNGVRVNGELIGGPTPLAPGDKVALGESEIVVDHRLTVASDPLAPGDQQSSAARNGFNRNADIDLAIDTNELFTREIEAVSTQDPAASAGLLHVEEAGFLDAVTVQPAPEFYRRVRAINRYEGTVVELPTPPEAPGRWRVGGSAQHRYDTAKAAFHQSIRKLIDELAAEQATERAERLRAAPSIDEVEEIVGANSHRLWERAMGDHDALSVRIGLADQASLTRLVTPKVGENPLANALDAVQRGFEAVSAVPVVADVADGLRLVGQPEQITELASSVLCQLAGTHSPSELMLGAVVSSATESDWDWLKWLPHCQEASKRLGVSLLSPSGGGSLDLIAAVVERVRHRNRRNGEALGAGSSPGQWPALVLLVDERADLPTESLSEILEDGPANGVHLVWLAVEEPALVEPLGTTVTIDRVPALGTSERSATVVTATGSIAAVAVELFDAERRLRFARKLAPIVDRSGRLATDGLGSPTVELAQLFDGAPTAQVMRSLWSVPPVSLRTPIGKTAHGPLALDLRSAGPHAFIVGDDASGKTTLLETLVSSLAINYAPAAVEFFLVGSPHSVDRPAVLGPDPLARCGRFPHVTGYLNESRRAGAALIEIKAAIEARSAGGAVGVPSLILAIDDLSLWADVAPDFVSAVVDSIEGASAFGVHMVATAGADRSNLAGLRSASVERALAMAGIRVALRTSDTSVSKAVVGFEGGADIDRLTPGRGYIRVGDEAATLFQSAAARQPAFPAERVTATEFRFDTPAHPAPVAEIVLEDQLTEAMIEANRSASMV